MNYPGFDPSGLDMTQGIGDPRRQSQLPGGYATQGQAVSAPYAQANMRAAEKTNPDNFATIMQRDAENLDLALFREQTVQSINNTELMGKDLHYWASTLLDLSRKGLNNRDILSKKGKNETLFLNHLRKVVFNKSTNADYMIDKFSNNENLEELYDK